MRLKIEPLCLAMLISMSWGCKKDAAKEIEYQKGKISAVPLRDALLTNSLPLEVYKTSGSRLFGKDTIFSSSAAKFTNSFIKLMPTGFDNAITRIRLKQGYQVVLAENSDGSGSHKFYLSVSSDLDITLPTTISSKVSFIRCLPIDIPSKKGTGWIGASTVNSLASPWYYNWGLNVTSGVNTGSYCPMIWGAGGSSNENLSTLITNKRAQILGFNEPDGADQSNITVATALTSYKNALYSGQRMGSPVCTQGEAVGSGKWLTNFMAGATTQNLRVDFIAVHWYDWGSHTQNTGTEDQIATNIFNRFKAYIESVRNAYNRTIWVTEFNANRNRTSSSVHQKFMELAVAWLNSTTYIERYAYFFPPDLPPVNANGTLTPIGTKWKNLTSPSSRTVNINW